MGDSKNDNNVHSYINTLYMNITDIYILSMYCIGKIIILKCIVNEHVLYKKMYCI